MWYLVYHKTFSYNMEGIVCGRFVLEKSLNILLVSFFLTNIFCLTRRIFGSESQARKLRLRSLYKDTNICCEVKSTNDQPLPIVFRQLKNFKIIGGYKKSPDNIKVDFINLPWDTNRSFLDYFSIVWIHFRT